MLSPLSRKLLRDLWSMRGQVITISLVVMAGVTLYVMMNGTLSTLMNTQQAYYDRYRMADAWAPVSRAPLHAVEKLKQIEGVRSVVGRISAAALLDMPKVKEPISGLILSLPQAGSDTVQPDVNAIYLEKGRLPVPGTDEIVIEQEFLTAHGLDIGDTINATLYGFRRELKVVGTGLTPEYTYSIPPGELMPDAARFAIMWMAKDTLSHAFDMDGAFNEAVFTFERGASEPEILRQIDNILDDYGSVGAYGREDQMSDEFLRSEFEQLKVLGGMLPPIFMAVAAFLLNIIVMRIVEQEREQIGLMKAFGYRPVQIGMHYIKLAMVIIVLGVGSGWYVGTQMGGGVMNIFQEIYKFPELIFRPEASIYTEAGLFALVAGVAGVMLAIRKVIGLRPAVAMSPPAPTDYSRLKLSRGALSWMDQGLRLIVRHLMRWPLRSMLTCLGIALGTMMMVGAQSNVDAMHRMVSMQFDLASKMDMTITFTDPQDMTTMHEVAAMQGVLKVEPFLGVPVTLKNEHLYHHQGLTGVPAVPELSLLLDAEDRPVNPPIDGLVLSESLAKVLNVAPGDMLEVKVKTGRKQTLQIPVSRLVSTYLGTPAYMEIGALNAIMQDGDRMSGLHLIVDGGEMDKLYDAFKAMPRIAGVSTNTSAKASMTKLLDEVMGTMTFFNTMFATMIAVGVVFSSARISLFERAREIASLRVLGFTLSEVNFILLGELMVIVFLAIPLGMYLGTALAGFMAENMSSELFRIPLVVSMRSYGFAATVITIAAVASAAIIARDVAKLDMVIALKTRE